MDSANLVKLSAPKGIDLTHVAGVASDLYGVAKKRPRTRLEVKLGIDVRETASGRATRTSKHPTWTIAELGQAGKGIGPIPWAAAMYSFAGARDSYYWPLWNALASEAQRVARRENWAPRVIGLDGQPKFYREKLAQLVLDEDGHQRPSADAPLLYAREMAVAPVVWNQSLNDPFRSLKGSYERWLNIARSKISQWIREPDHIDAIDNTTICE